MRRRGSGSKATQESHLELDIRLAASAQAIDRYSRGHISEMELPFLVVAWLVSFACYIKLDAFTPIVETYFERITGGEPFRAAIDEVRRGVYTAVDKIPSEIYQKVAASDAGNKALIGCAAWYNTENLMPSSMKSYLGVLGKQIGYKSPFRCTQGLLTRISGLSLDSIRKKNIIPSDDGLNYLMKKVWDDYFSPIVSQYTRLDSLPKEATAADYFYKIATVSDQVKWKSGQYQWRSLSVTPPEFSVSAGALWRGAVENKMPLLAGWILLLLVSFGALTLLSAKKRHSMDLAASRQAKQLQIIDNEKALAGLKEKHRRLLVTEIAMGVVVLFGAITSIHGMPTKREANIIPPIMLVGLALIMMPLVEWYHAKCTTAWESFGANIVSRFHLGEAESVGMRMSVEQHKAPLVTGVMHVVALEQVLVGDEWHSLNGEEKKQFVRWLIKRMPECGKAYLEEGKLYLKTAVDVDVLTKRLTEYREKVMPSLRMKVAVNQLVTAANARCYCQTGRGVVGSSVEWDISRLRSVYVGGVAAVFPEATVREASDVVHIRGASPVDEKALKTLLDQMARDCQKSRESSPSQSSRSSGACDDFSRCFSASTGRLHGVGRIPKGAKKEARDESGAAADVDEIKKSEEEEFPETATVDLEVRGREQNVTVHKIGNHISERCYVALLLTSREVKDAAKLAFYEKVAQMPRWGTSIKGIKGKCKFTDVINGNSKAQAIAELRLTGLYGKSRALCIKQKATLPDGREITVFSACGEPLSTSRFHG